MEKEEIPIQDWKKRKYNNKNGKWKEIFRKDQEMSQAQELSGLGPGFGRIRAFSQLIHGANDIVIDGFGCNLGIVIFRKEDACGYDRVRPAGLGGAAELLKAMQGTMFP